MSVVFAWNSWLNTEVGRVIGEIGGNGFLCKRPLKAPRCQAQWTQRTQGQLTEEQFFLKSNSEAMKPCQTLVPEITKPETLNLKP